MSDIPDINKQARSIVDEATAGVQMATCSVCGEVRPCRNKSQKPGQPPPAMVCLHCERDAAT